MNCDNLPHNGKVVRGTVTGLAGLTDPDLVAWINAHVAFPNGMVDRITPVTSDYEPCARRGPSLPTLAEIETLVSPN